MKLKYNSNNSKNEENNLGIDAPARKEKMYWE